MAGQGAESFGEAAAGRTPDVAVTWSRGNPNPVPNIGVAPGSGIVRSAPLPTVAVYPTADAADVGSMCARQFRYRMTPGGSP